jgi:PAS domain S-box-containing protein
MERAEKVAQSGSWEWDLATEQLLWSDNVYRIFGVEPGEITPTPAYIAERTHLDDRDRLEQMIDDARRHGQSQPIEHRIVRADGAVRHVRSLPAIVACPGGQHQKLVGSVQDVTDWRDAERQIAARVAVSESLARWQEVEQGAVDLLRNLAGALDCLAGVLWVPQEDKLAPRALWRSGSKDASALTAEILSRRRGRGAGLPGTAWQTKEPQTRSEAGDSNTERQGMPTGLVAIPAIHREEVLAVLELHSCEPSRPDMGASSFQSLAGIGYELGQFLSHRRGELSPPMLTPRQLDVLRLAAQGRTAPEIAEELVVSPSTVSTHLKNIYEKYGVSDRASAVAKALREGLID